MAELYNEIFGQTTRKKKVDGNRKGGENERALCKALEKWAGFEFNRVPHSGGLRWKKGEGITGDVVPGNKSFPFVIETKFYKNFEITGNLRNNSIIYTFWGQAAEDARRFNESSEREVFPLVFARKNDMGANWWVFAACEIYHVFRQHGLKDPDCITGIKSGHKMLNGFKSKNLFETDYRKIEEHFLHLSK